MSGMLKKSASEFYNIVLILAKSMLAGDLVLLQLLYLCIGASK